MITFQSTQKNDLALNGGGSLSFISDAECSAQTSRQFVQARLAEMLFKYDQGMPFDDVVWGGSPNIAQFEASARIRILQVPGVIEVVSLDAQQNGDNINYTAVIRDQTGEITISG